MSKRLLSRDYQQFVKELLSLEPKDIYYFLLDFCESNYSKNKNIIPNLIEVIEPIYQAGFTNYYKELSLKGNVIQENSLRLDFAIWEYETFDDFKEHNTEQYELLVSFFNSNKQIDNLTYNEFLFSWIHLCLNLINHTIELLNTQKTKEFSQSKEVINSILLQLGRIDFSNLDVEFYNERLKDFQLITGDTLQLVDTENTFNNVPIKTVRGIFGVLTTKKNSLKPPTPFIDETQLNEFIDCAFLGKELKQKIKIQLNHDKDYIRLKHLFYTFKQYSKDYESKERVYQNRDYIQLFTEYFETPQTVDKFKEGFSKQPKQKDKVLLKKEDIKEH